jgi:hypothetical protein
MNSQGNVMVVQRATCLDAYIESFESHLRARNYTPGTIKTYRILVRRLATTMEAQGLAPSCLTTEQAADLVRGEERKAREPHKYANIARRFVEH